jgi:hypothetical protein
MMDIPPPLDGEFSSEDFPGTGVSQTASRTGAAGAPRAVARRAARSFRASALSARIARASTFSPPHSVPVVSRAPSHATSGGA